MTMHVPAYGPLKLSPRLDAKPWGARRLERFGFELPPHQKIGEALITASEAIILNGPLRGNSLGETIALDPVGTTGERGLAVTRGLPLFPLLIKLIDAAEHLSIQVHPSDATAPIGSLGKTEAWHVLDAEPDSKLFLGLKDDVTTADFARVSRLGQSTAHLMRSVHAIPGMTVFLPAGTVHALGAGVLIYEIQQPSGITYRLDDWGRTDADGKSRELHIEHGIAVIDPDSRPEAIAPESLSIAEGTRTRLVHCPLFTAERLTIPAGADVQFSGEDAPQVFTVLSGVLGIEADGEVVTLSAGESAAILASSGVARLRARGNVVALRGWLDPDG